MPPGWRRDTTFPFQRDPPFTGPAALRDLPALRDPHDLPALRDPPALHDLPAMGALSSC